MRELTLWSGATAPTRHELDETCRARRYDYTDPKHGEVFAFRTHCTCGAGMVHGILARQPLFGLTREEVLRQAAQEVIAEHAWRVDAGKRARWPVFYGRNVIATGARATMPVWVVVPPKRHRERNEMRAGEPAGQLEG
jgi:hypothetical protein